MYESIVSSPRVPKNLPGKSLKPQNAKGEYQWMSPSRRGVPREGLGVGAVLKVILAPPEYLGRPRGRWRLRI
jgi:hypothetical protein